MNMIWRADASMWPSGHTHARKAARTSARGGIAWPFSVHSILPAALTNRWLSFCFKSSRTWASICNGGRLSNACNQTTYLARMPSITIIAIEVINTFCKSS